MKGNERNYKIKLQLKMEFHAYDKNEEEETKKKKEE